VPQSPDEEVEVVARLPTESLPRASVDIHALDGAGDGPSASRVFRFVARAASTHDGGSIGAQLQQILAREGRRRADDEPIESDLARLHDRELVCADDVL